MTLLAVALDTPDVEEALVWARSVRHHTDVMKVGLELFASAGPQAVRRVMDATGLPVFLDLKLSDIPATVAGATRAVARLGVRYLTVHTSAGEDACRAAVDSAGDVKVLGVTVLTSLPAAPSELSARCQLAQHVGMYGVVCAGTDLAIVADAAPGLFTVVPGVRPAGSDSHDQERVATPAAAARGGAGMIVVGRPLTRAEFPAAIARRIQSELAMASRS